MKSLPVPYLLLPVSDSLDSDRTSPDIAALPLAVSLVDRILDQRAKIRNGQ